MHALLDLQRSFAAGLRGQATDADAWAEGDGIPAAARLRLYRNNVRAAFERALEATYPVLRERVGQDYFRQLVHFYRQAHPPAAGDLHESGRHYPAFLRAHLTGGCYAWLADLAMLEWAVAEAGVAAEAAVASAAALAGLDPEAIAGVRLRFVPSLQRVSAAVPVLDVWRANQPGADRAPVDLDTGPQFVLVHRGVDGVQLRGLEAAEFSFVAALADGVTLQEAIDASVLPLEQLPALLHALFADGMVAQVIPPGIASR